MHHQTATFGLRCGVKPRGGKMLMMGGWCSGHNVVTRALIRVVPRKVALHTRRKEGAKWLFPTTPVDRAACLPLSPPSSKRKPYCFQSAVPFTSFRGPKRKLGAEWLLAAAAINQKLAPQTHTHTHTHTHAHAHRSAAMVCVLIAAQHFPFSLR